MTGAACAIPRPHLDRVRGALASELVRARKQHPGVPDNDLVGSVAWAPIVELRDAIRSVRMPQMRTMDDEALVFGKAYYVVRDAAAVRLRLHQIADLQSDDDGEFTWLNRGGNARMGEG